MLHSFGQNECAFRWAVMLDILIVWLGGGGAGSLDPQVLRPQHVKRKVRWNGPDGHTRGRQFILKFSTCSKLGLLSTNTFVAPENFPTPPFFSFLQLLLWPVCNWLPVSSCKNKREKKGGFWPGMWRAYWGRKTNRVRKRDSGVRRIKTEIAIFVLLGNLQRWFFVFKVRHISTHYALKT